MFPGAVVGAERHCALHFMGVVVISFFNQTLGYNGSNEACNEYLTTMSSNQNIMAYPTRKTPFNNQANAPFHI